MPSTQDRSRVHQLQGSFTDSAIKIPSLSVLPIFLQKYKSVTFCMAQKSEGKTNNDRLQRVRMSLCREAKTQKSIHTWRSCHTQPFIIHFPEQNFCCWLRGSNTDRNRAPTQKDSGGWWSPFPMLKLHLARGRGSLAVKASAEASSGQGEFWALVLTGSSVTLIIQLFAD